MLILNSDFVQNPFAIPSDNLERLFHRTLYCIALISWLKKHKVRRYHVLFMLESQLDSTLEKGVINLCRSRV